MKVKYFIRGLGLGILVTALILGISYKSKNSDEDVILRAKKLGMVFSEDVSGAAIGVDVQKTDEPVIPAEPSAVVNPTKEPVTEPKDELTVSTDKPTAKPTTEPEEISFSIKKGDWGSIVSEKLESLGIIDDAREFDKYLVEHGYSVRIKVGDFSLKKGASFDEIAKMITN